MYLAIPDFKFGMDRRRERVSGVPGTLWELKNAHITRGGDIERAKKFVSKYTLPAGTFGLAKLRRQLYAFGSNVAPTMPIGVLYQRLQNGTANMTRLLDWGVFKSKIYAIAEYDDGNVYHFYDGARVIDWDTIAAGNSDVTTLAAYLEQKINGSTDVTALASGPNILVTARTPGTGFTISAAATGTGTATVTTVQANVPQVNETRATGTITITGGTNNPGVNKVAGLTVNGVALTAVAIDWVLSNSSTASALATEINNRTATHGYTAVAVGAVVTITARPGSGATVNGQVIVFTGAGNVTATTSGTVSGGVTFVAPVAQVSQVALGGTFAVGDKYTVTVNGTSYVATGRASGTGVNVFVYKSRVWSLAGSLIVGCALNAPTDFHTGTPPATAFVSIDVSNDSEGTERLAGMALYQTYVAIYSRNAIRIYSFAADATQISLIQAIANSGTYAGHSLLAYGSTDLYFLDETGYRSIRPQFTTSATYVNDVGTAVDPFLRAHVDSLPSATVQNAVATMEPVDGRLWLAMGERIYVLSYFPTSKVTAWSYYVPPAPITAFARIDNQIYARGGDIVYLYGGDSGKIYPAANEQVVVVDGPFLAANAPASEKDVYGFDDVLTNEWLVEALIDPNDEAKVETLGRFNRTTYHLPDIGAAFRTSMFALRFTCSSAGPATLSSMAVHFKKEDPAK